MIVLNLVCQLEHRFEGWFASASAFDCQRQDGMVSCPVCNSTAISRLPSGPHIVSPRVGSGQDERPDTETLAAVQEQLLETLKVFARDSENVGERFPEEARKMHYHEVPARNIRGIASLKETRDLLDGGIVVLPLPVPPSDETH
jgi:hypothetical protein